MKITLFALLTVLSFVTFSQTYIHGTPYVEVTGEGKMEVIPDKIVLAININEYQKSKETLPDREQKMRTALEDLGINTKETLAILDFKSDYSYYNRRDIKMTKMYSLTLTNPDIVSKVYVKLEEIGISNITLSEVTHSKMNEYEQQVKLEAVKSAKFKADGMLAQLDQKVGKTLFIQEKGKFLPSEYFADASSYYRAQMNATGAVSRGASDPEYYLPELSFKKIELEYNVLVRFEIL